MLGASEEQRFQVCPEPEAGANGESAPASKQSPSRGRHEAVKLAVAEIEVGEPIRPLSEERIARLAEAIKAVGLLSPIIARPVGREKKPTLVAGYARLAAVKRLGWKTIAAVFFRGGEVEARIEEIDDNFRGKLTALEEGVLLLERKKQYELLYPETNHGGDRRSHGFSIRQIGELKSDGEREAAILSFSQSTSRRLGISTRNIERAVRRAKRIEPAAQKELFGTPFEDIGAELDALTFLSPEEQVAAVQDAKSTESTIREVVARMNAAARQKVSHPGNVLNLDVELLRRKWRRLSPNNRIAFLDWLVSRNEATRQSSRGQATFTIKIFEAQPETSSAERENETLADSG